MDFEIRKSSKLDAEGKEQFNVVRDSVVYLRILREELKYRTMTATAGEDDGLVSSFNEQDVLISTVLEMSKQHNWEVNVMRDMMGRRYVRFGLCDDLADVSQLAEELFEILDNKEKNSTE